MAAFTPGSVDGLMFNLVKERAPILNRNLIPLALVALLVLVAVWQIDGPPAFDNLPGEVITGFTITDGDTIRLGKERVRLVGFDTPEVFSPGCQEEKNLGDKATIRLGALLASGTVTIERHGFDKYARTLGTIRVNGADVAVVMIGEGLARARKPSGGWCAVLAE